jgi:molybdenum cofactor cytidylyltransferase
VTHPICGAVLLGAGFSRRFGSDKRLHPLHGRTVAECTVDLYTQAFEHVRVVIRPQDHILAAKLAVFGAELITAADAHLGMGHSLAAGMKSLTWQWAFVGLLDMPFITAGSLEKLKNIALKTKHPAIIRPYFLDHTQPTSVQSEVTYGHPIGWHSSYFSALAQCQGDQGARSLLKTYKKHVIGVDVADPGIVQDIDTPQDLPGKTLS